MTHQELTEIAALAAIRYFSKTAGEDLKPGRLKNRYKKITEHIDLALRWCLTPTEKEMNIIKGHSDEFVTRSGWGTKGKHTMTIINFLLNIAGDVFPAAEPEEALKFSRWKHHRHIQWVKIKELMIDIMDYYEKVDDQPAASLWAGKLNAQKWQEVFGC